MKKLQISLAAARVNAGLTQRDVAAALGVAPNTVCDWENGKTELSYNRALALAEMYNLPLDYIFLPAKSD